MEPELVDKLFKRAHEIIAETKTLYEIGDAETIFMTHIIMQAVGLGLSANTTAKLLKAAAHFIEASDDMAESFVKEFKK